MSQIYLIADLHLGHSNILNFTNGDGSKVRPFSSVEEMNQTIIQNWNRTVGKNDTVYVLGDVVINKKHLHLVGELEGRKILVKGNHDEAPIAHYTKYFSDIRGACQRRGYILTHIPVHESQKGRFKGNIHGHLHSTVIADPWYKNVCVEQVNYTPVPFDF